MIIITISSTFTWESSIFFFSITPVVTDNAPYSCPFTGVTFMLSIFTGLDCQTAAMLVLALAFVLFYEAINGFHDTANAVATVIYTRAMRAKFAVVMAGIFNFFGVLLGGLSVAYAIVHLLPIDLLLNVGSAHGLAMVFSLLLAAIIWNLCTWYFGLPVSSSHTLIGAIIGVGLTNAMLTSTSLMEALNISKMIRVFLSLFLSPLIGLVVAGLMLFLLRRYWNGTKKRQRIHLTPVEREKKDGKRKPPFWTRTMLIFSAIGVSFSHGANDGQKGIGLIMLALIGVAPSGFIVNMNATSYDIAHTRDALAHLEQFYQKNSGLLAQASALNPPLPVASEVIHPVPEEFRCQSTSAMAAIAQAQMLLANLQSYADLKVDQRSRMRHLLMCVADTVSTIAKLPQIHREDRRLLRDLRKDLLKTVEYAPMWIIVAVALALSLGTTVGWQRVATTIGEKIGKKGMTYAQGVSAQMTAAIGIGIASYTGMPVSTTQVLSSAVTGTMLAGGGGIQIKTVQNILLAWIMTLPVSIVLSGMLYWLVLKFI